MKETNNALQEDSQRDIQCGLGPCRKIKFLQNFANKNVYVFVYGLLGCVSSASSAYAKSTISTIEKRFKLPSKTTGIISVGNDVSSMFATLVLSYYAGKSHRPRWIAAGVYSVALYCFIKMLPHVLWGAGEDALSLTTEHGGAPDAQLAEDIILKHKRKTLCRAGLNDSLAGAECLVPGSIDSDVGFAPALILFLANFVSGLGGKLYHALGISYMDDNIKKSKAPFLVSVSYFMKMLGPALGYGLGSVFLKIYIAPYLTPTISNKDPRWLGAWWGGWLIFGVALAVLGSVMGMFPRTLPSAVKRQNKELEAAENKSLITNSKDEEPSFKDMKKTLQRLIYNKIFMCNTTAAMFYMFGFMPFWVFTPKYIEVQYHTSASRASFFTGSVGLACSALGVLISGIIISQFKPRARYLAAWNVIVSLISVAAMLTYPFLGCVQSDHQSLQIKTDVNQVCNSGCQCEFVKYSPVCSEDGKTTYISACHAGCTDYHLQDGKKVYTNCSCISPIHDNKDKRVENSTFSSPSKYSKLNSVLSESGRSFGGVCPVDCTLKFYTYIAIVCLLKFSGATGRTSNFLVSVRCVEKQDKATSMGFSMMLYNMFVFIPSPIIFGYLIDGTCLVWGQTCSGKGNCWQYDGEAMRYLMNFSAAAFVAIGTMFDVGVWYYVKDLKIFDEEEKDNKKTQVDEDAAQELIEMQRTNAEVETPKERVLVGPAEQRHLVLNATS